MSGKKIKLSVLILLIFSFFEYSCKTADLSECKLLEPNKIQVNSIDSILKKLNIGNYTVLDNYICNDSFIMCYPKIKEKFELAKKYKDSVINLIEPYYKTLNRKSINDLNFIVFYEDMKKFMVNESLDSAFKYDLGYNCRLLRDHLKLKEDKSQLEIDLVEKLEVYFNRIWKINIAEIFEVFQWRLENKNRPIFIKTQDNKSKKYKYFLYENENLIEIGIMN